MHKLYIIVRADFAPGYQLAQACHAVSAFAVAHPAAHASWYRDGKNIVVLAARDRAHITSLLERAAAHELPHAEFCETDLGCELTAFAVDDRARKIVSSLPLAGTVRSAAA